MAANIGSGPTEARERKGCRHDGRRHHRPEEMEQGQEVGSSPAIYPDAGRRQVTRYLPKIRILILEAAALQRGEDGINARAPSTGMELCTDTTSDTPFSQFDTKFDLFSMIQCKLACLYHD